MTCYMMIHYSPIKGMYKCVKSGTMPCHLSYVFMVDYARQKKEDTQKLCNDRHQKTSSQL